MNWFTMAVAGGMLATRLLEPQDQPRQPQPRPAPEARRDGEPRPEGRRPEPPRPEGDRRPEGRPEQPRRDGEPRPEGRRPEPPRPEGDRLPESRPEDRERAERRERAQQQVNRINEEMQNHANAIRELGEKLMRANKELVEAGGQPQPGGPRMMMFQGQGGPGVFSFEKRFEFGGPGGGQGGPRGPMGQPGPGGPGAGPDAARRLENLERRLDEVMKRLEQMNRGNR